MYPAIQLVDNYIDNHSPMFSTLTLLHFPLSGICGLLRHYQFDDQHDHADPPVGLSTAGTQIGCIDWKRGGRTFDLFVVGRGERTDDGQEKVEEGRNGERQLLAITVSSLKLRGGAVSDNRPPN